MKSLFMAGTMLATAFTGQAAEELLAFPGAEGFGRYTIGGRYGADGKSTAEIYHVTNLNDSGTGSLRDAVSQKGRIIIFDVCGTIYLKSALVFQGHNTILGQTAPGEGIQVYGNRVSFSGANELIVRHMRFRMGSSGDSGKDACGIANGENMIFDHVSALWGKDENFSVNPDNKGIEPRNITIQNSIIGQGLQQHSCGGLIQTNGGVTLYRNLYIENKTRNPKVKGICQFVNNVLYNWGNAAAYNMSGDSEGTSWAEITDNYFVKGPWKSAARPLTGGNERQHYYGEGNYYDSNINGVLDGAEFTEENYSQSGGNRASSIDEVNVGMAAQTTGTAKAFPEIAGRQTAPEALEWVLKNVGASLPVHDEVDRYLLDELASFGSIGTSNGISTEKVLPHQGTGTLYGGFKPTDSDKDGIPDEWEIANGLNPNDATDAVKIAANGYTNIENYVFDIDSPYPYVKNPTALKATKIEKNAITITWKDNSDDEIGFAIEISTDNSNFTEVGKTDANVNSFTASNLADNTVYYFRVKALGDGIESSYSPSLKSLTIDEPYAPKATTLLSPANGANMRILNSSLSWENKTEDYFGDITYTL
ncbi:MAG: fibronectin type III domain-containing protein, partial [Duncaniella sp.]|nr:fibronectin type III domain-containing protein [Duncaniella sp.]